MSEVYLFPVMTIWGVCQTNLTKSCPCHLALPRAVTLTEGNRQPPLGRCAALQIKQPSIFSITELRQCTMSFIGWGPGVHVSGPVIQSRKAGQVLLCTEITEPTKTSKPEQPIFFAHLCWRLSYVRAFSMHKAIENKLEKKNKNVLNRSKV